VQDIWTLLWRNSQKEDAGNSIVRAGTIFEMFKKTKKWFDIINRIEFSIFSNSQPLENTRQNPFARIESSYPQKPLFPKDIKKDRLNVLA
jgi:hypothetical protein